MTNKKFVPLLSLLPKYQIHIQPCILTAYPIYTHTHTPMPGAGHALPALLCLQ